MPQGFYRELTDILKTELGAYYLRNGKGSHEIWKTESGLPVTVPRNCYNRTTANEVLKQAGLTKRF
jgi:predicted RNA binding protein YcfA (HicA-like mRNA interferase family)